MLTISATIKQPPQLSVANIVADILGSQYDLTIVYIGRDRARGLNQQHRGKSYVPNVLSFPLSDTCGEIYICTTVAASEAKKFDLWVPGYLTSVVVHGAPHLKGHDHGAKMDAAEARYIKKYNIT